LQRNGYYFWDEWLGYGNFFGALHQYAEKKPHHWRELIWRPAFVSCLLAFGTEIAAHRGGAGSEHPSAVPPTTAKPGPPGW